MFLLCIYRTQSSTSDALGERNFWPGTLKQGYETEGPLCAAVSWKLSQVNAGGNKN